MFRLACWSASGLPQWLCHLRPYLSCKANSRLGVSNERCLRITIEALQMPCVGLVSTSICYPFSVVQVKVQHTLHNQLRTCGGSCRRPEIDATAAGTWVLDSSIWLYPPLVWSDSAVTYNVSKKGNLMLTETTLTRVYSKPCCG